MPLPKLTRLELQIMEALWTRGALSIRKIQETFPARNRPAYSTVQTTVYRLENKKALRRVKKISTAHIFEGALSRDAARGKLIDDLLCSQTSRDREGSGASSEPPLPHGRGSFGRKLARGDQSRSSS
jgi:predicted transcriptional regulator